MLISKFWRANLHCQDLIKGQQELPHLILIERICRIKAAKGQYIGYLLLGKGMGFQSNDDPKIMLSRIMPQEIDIWSDDESLLLANMIIIVYQVDIQIKVRFRRDWWAERKNSIPCELNVFLCKPKRPRGMVWMLLIIARFRSPHHHSSRGHFRSSPHDEEDKQLFLAVRGGSDDGEENTSSLLFAEVAMMGRTPLAVHEGSYEGEGKKDPPHPSETLWVNWRRISFFFLAGFWPFFTCLWP